MIPETIGAFLAFLALVAPGLVYQLRRESVRASVAETAFREASRVALVSFVLSAAALAALAVVRLIHPAWMPDPGEWLRSGNSYVVRHYRLVVRTAVLAVATSCLLALAADLVQRRFGSAHGNVSKTSIWFRVLRDERPPHRVPWVHLHLKSGADYWGFVGYYSAEMPQLDREISITGPGLQYRASQGAATVELDGDWHTVMIAASEIEYAKVTYLPEQAAR